MTQSSSPASFTKGRLLTTVLRFFDLGVRRRLVSLPCVIQTFCERLGDLRGRARPLPQL